MRQRCCATMSVGTYPYETKCWRIYETCARVGADGLLGRLHPATKGEPAWPPLAMFRAMLLAVWYDLSDVKLADARDDRASFRRFCGFSGTEATPERTAFVRFRRLHVERPPWGGPG